MPDLETIAARTVAVLADCHIHPGGGPDWTDPFQPAADFPQALARAFGGPVEALLYASTHKPAAAEFGGVWAVNPGSALLPGEGAKPTFARLSVDAGRLRPEIVTLG